MRACLLTGLLPLTVSAGIFHKHTKLTTTTTLTLAPVTIPSTLPTVSTIQKPAATSVLGGVHHAAPKGEDVITDTRKAHDRFKLVALEQHKDEELDGDSTGLIWEDHEYNGTIALWEDTNNIWVPTLNLKATVSGDSSATNAIFNLRKGRLETDDQASDIHDVLYLGLLGDNEKNPSYFLPTWTTNKNKKHIWNSKIVHSDSWQLVKDQSTGIYRLANSDVDGDWSLCNTMFYHQLSRNTAQVSVAPTTLIYGDRTKLTNDLDCKPIGLQASWS